MKRRFSLFTYPMMDMKAAEAELNRRAAAGWTAEWCRRQLGAAGQPPLEGYEGVWHIRSGERTETAEIEEPSGYRYYEVTRLGWRLRYDGELDGFADSYEICIDLYTGQVLSIDMTR